MLLVRDFKWQSEQHFKSFDNKNDVVVTDMKRDHGRRTMRRLNDAELDARIHKFLSRKFGKFPELNISRESSEASWVYGRPRLRHYQSSMGWGAESLYG